MWYRIMCTTHHGFGRVNYGCYMSPASFAVPSSFLYGDARCTGDREQQLHEEGRKMEAPLAFPWRDYSRRVYTAVWRKRQSPQYSNTAHSTTTKCKIEDKFSHKPKRALPQKLWYGYTMKTLPPCLSACLSVCLYVVCCLSVVPGRGHRWMSTSRNNGLM